MYHHHKQVLDGFVKLYIDIVRLYESQSTLPNKITESKGFYWPFFKAHLTFHEMLLHTYQCTMHLFKLSFFFFFSKEYIGALYETHI